MTNAASVGRGLRAGQLLLSRARGPASPIHASHGTTTATRTTGVNKRNTGADSKGAVATAVAPVSGTLAATGRAGEKAAAF